ncbi:MAG: EamA family transporter, partial [Chloroflexota bacterium]
MITRRDLAARRLRIPDTTGWGVALAFVVALISGISVFVNSYGVKQVPDPAVYTTLKNGVAALILIGFAALVVRGAEVRALAPGSWVKLGIIGIIGGSVPFILFFSGLAIASAPTAAFIHKTLFVWVAILAVPFLGERLGIFPIAALGVLLAGQFLAAPPTGVVWGIGETMILTATLLWGIEVVIAKRLLIADVPSPLVAAARLGIGLVVLVGYLGIT